MNSLVSDPVSSNQYGLITRERAEKFDLLGQLILNQREAIILCGAEGIGKTTLLNSFKNARENIWPICLLQGRDIVDFEQIKTLLVLTMQEHQTELLDQDLTLMLSLCEQKQQKLVLLIDDAAYLADGLITALTEYALQNPVLRIVFSVTREQLYLKNITDRTVDDCYFMQLPALTKSQTATFLQENPLLFNGKTKTQAINDKLLNKLYLYTAGVPGKILTELPLLITARQKKIFKPSLKMALIICAIVMSVAFVQVYKTGHQADTLNLQSIVSSLPIKPVKNLPVKQNVQAIAKPKQKTQTVVTGNFKSLPVVVAKIPEIAANKQLAQADVNEQWILQQAPGKYSLQLMALSKRQPLESIVKKYPNLQENLKILQLNNHKQGIYILLYGSFSDTRTAYAAVGSLPAQFKQAWPRKIKTLQHELKKQPVSLPKPKQLP